MTLVVLVIALIVVGVLVGYAIHQRNTLQEAQYEINSYRDGEVRSAEQIATLKVQADVDAAESAGTIAALKAEIKAHEVTLEMLMAEVMN